jgi:hypothetical protein
LQTVFFSVRREFFSSSGKNQRLTKQKNFLFFPGKNPAGKIDLLTKKSQLQHTFKHLRKNCTLPVFHRRSSDHAAKALLR